MIKRYFVMALVTMGLIGGSLAVSAAPAEAQWRGRGYQVRRHGHWITRCPQGWGNARSYSRRSYRGYERPYARSYSGRYPRAYSRSYAEPYWSSRSHRPD